MLNLEYKRKDWGESQIVGAVPAYGNKGKEFLNYTFKPIPTFISKKNTKPLVYLGIELEYESDPDESEDYFLDDFVDDLHERSSEAFPDLFYTKHDSSFHGPEFVFQPVSFLAFLELANTGYWKTFFETKNQYYHVSPNVGLHVHLDKFRENIFEADDNQPYFKQNYQKITFALGWLHGVAPEVFKGVLKRKRLNYCTPKSMVTSGDHHAAINETDYSYELRFWSAPKTLGRFYYCIAASKAADIVSRDKDITSVRDILHKMFIDIPLKMKGILDINPPKELNQLEKVLKG